MFKDKIILGILVALLANTVKLTFNYISFMLNFTDAVFWQLIAALFLDREDVFTPLGLLIGATADSIVMGFLGVIFIYFIYLTGKENLWIKGIGFGMLIWVSFFGVLLIQLIKNTIPPTPSGIIVTIVAHLLFGISLALFTKLLAGDLGSWMEDLQIKKPVHFKLLSSESIKKRTVKTLKDKYKKPEKI